MINEFVCIWFETSQCWVVIYGNTIRLARTFPSIGAAVNAALEWINAGEADFICIQDTGSFYRYERDTLI